MSISLVSQQGLKLSQLYVAPKTPDSHFYEQFKAAYAGYADEQAGIGSSHALASNGVPDQGNKPSVMGDLYSEMARRRGTSAQDTLAYACILNQAYNSNGISDPQGFLKSLSAYQLAVVQHVHGLAETINTYTLSREGATNLLLPDGYSVDLNHDHQEEIGAAIAMHFPPRDAPAEFLQAWATIVDDMGEDDVMTYSLIMHSAIFGKAGSGEQIEPADKHASDRLDTYRDIVLNALNFLAETPSGKPDGQHTKDLAFYTRLQSLLDRQ